MGESAEIDTRTLALELSQRKDLVRSDGWLEPEVFGLRSLLGPMPTADGIPLRRRSRDWRTEIGLIRRNTGPYTGKLCFIGGAVLLNESLEQALRRHFMTDLNARIELFDPSGWERPFRVWPYYSSNQSIGQESLHNPTRHCVSSTFLVRILNEKEMAFGSTEVGGQEAREFQWFSFNALPTDEELSYGITRTMLKQVIVAASEIDLE